MSTAAGQVCAPSELMHLTDGIADAVDIVRQRAGEACPM